MLFLDEPAEQGFELLQLIRLFAALRFDLLQLDFGWLDRALGSCRVLAGLSLLEQAAEFPTGFVDNAQMHVDGHPGQSGQGHTVAGTAIQIKRLPLCLDEQIGVEHLVLQGVNDQLPHLAVHLLQQILEQIVWQRSGRRHLAQSHSQSLPFKAPDRYGHNLVVLAFQKNQKRLEKLLGVVRVSIGIDAEDLDRN